MIGTAIQNGNYVYVYDEHNSQIASRYGKLHGYTSTTFSVKDGNYVYTYDEHNSQVSSHYSD